MSDISKIKVNGAVYDVKDAMARESGLIRETMSWDGNTAGLPALSGSGLPYYRIHDAFDLQDQMLIATSSALSRAWIKQAMSGSNTEGMALMRTLANGNIFGIYNNLHAIISVDQKTAELFGAMGNKAYIMQLVETLDSLGIKFCTSYTAGLVMNTIVPIALNVTQDVTLTPEMLQGLGMSSEEGLDVAAGFYALLLPAENFWGATDGVPNDTHDVYPERIYHLTKLGTELAFESMLDFQTIMELNEEAAAAEA